MPIDPLALAADLIRKPSVTPADAGAQQVLAAALAPFGFTAEAMPFQSPGHPRIENLYLRRGTGGRHFCFAGHTDVVPVGDQAAWSAGPFAGAVKDGLLWGRGAADMKGAIAAFAAAAAGFVRDHGPDFDGSISLLITGDEEAASIDGTKRMLESLAARGERIDACLVGEPTSARHLGDMMKIGRRGSLNATITVEGVQGHVAYPHLAQNPLPGLVAVLDRLARARLDTGTAHFQPSNLELTSIDTGNTATNVIPARATARLNIRFNDQHTGESLTRWLEQECAAAMAGQGGPLSLDVFVSGEAFITPPGPLTGIIADAVAAETGRTPEASTTGGTSDARFIARYCPVVEFGLVGQTMHKVDERVAVDDIATLARIYRRILDAFFAHGGAA